MINRGARALVRCTGAGVPTMPKNKERPVTRRGDMRPGVYPLCGREMNEMTIKRTVESVGTPADRRKSRMEPVIQNDAINEGLKRRARGKKMLQWNFAVEIGELISRRPHANECFTDHASNILESLNRSREREN